MLIKPIRLGSVFVLFGLAFVPAVFGSQQNQTRNQTISPAPDTATPSIFFGPDPKCPPDLEVSVSGVAASDELEMRLISNLQRARDRKLIVCSWDLTSKLAWFYLVITDFPDRWRVYEEEVSYAERTLGPMDLLTLEIHTAVGEAYVDIEPDKAWRHLQAAAAVSPLPYQLSMT